MAQSSALVPSERSGLMRAGDLEIVSSGAATVVLLLPCAADLLVSMITVHLTTAVCSNNLVSCRDSTAGVRRELMGSQTNDILLLFNTATASSELHLRQFAWA